MRYLFFVLYLIISHQIIAQHYNLDSVKLSFDVSQGSNTTNHNSEAVNIHHNGILYQVYRYDSEGSHVGINGKLVIRNSTNYGETWSNFVVVHDDSQFDVRNPVFGKIKNKFYVFFRKSDPLTNKPHSVGYVVSENTGQIWSGYNQIILTNLNTQKSYAPIR